MVDFKKMRRGPGRRLTEQEQAAAEHRAKHAPKEPDDMTRAITREEIDEALAHSRLADIEGRPEPSETPACPPPPAPAKSLIEKVAAPLQLSEQQQGVMGMIENKENLLVTGPAGTGKSTLVKAIVAKYGDRIPITASTGIAAVGVGGITIHSWAGLGLADLPADKIARNIRDNNAKAYNNILRFNRLIIDEISMISCGLFEKIDIVFRILRKVDRPFGGMQMILFGDFLQLPPVVKEREAERKQLFCFESAIWYEAGIKTVVLNKIFRQADAEFAQALNDIRFGHVTPLVSKLLNSRYHKFRPADPNPEIKPVVVHTHNLDVEAINDAELAQIPGEAKVFVANDEGRESGKKLLEKNCLAATQIRLKVGAQVMLLCNLDQACGLANGSLGKIIGFANYDGRPVVKFSNGEQREIERNTWEIKDSGKVVATRNQIPLRLAYAITAHKSQGLTLDKISVFLAKCFEFGQAYVALSRAKTLDGLFIESGNKEAIKAHPKAVAFYEKNAA